MRMQSIVGRLCVLVVVGLAVGTRFTNADTVLLSYDFNNLSTGALAGQDGFSKCAAWPGDLTVSAGPWGSLNTSNCLYLNTANGTGDNETRSLASPLIFTAASPTINQTVEIYSGNAGCAQASLTFVDGPNHFPLFGLEGLRPYVRNTAGYEVWSETSLATDKWYEFKLAMDFSVAGGQGTLYYRNMTDGDTSFTAAAGLSNLALAIPENGSGQYVANAFNFRIDTGSSIACMDNFSVSQAVPEPATAVLCVTGLLGLLAYAWRKRK